MDNKLLIGSQHTSNYGDVYKIVNIVKGKRANNYRTSYVIQFIETGYKCSTRKYNIINGKVKDWSKLPSINQFTGKILTTKNGLKYTTNGEIVKMVGHHRYYHVEFLESKHVTSARLENIAKGSLRDRFHPTIAGVGFIGNANKKDNRKEYDLWRNILSRCYNSSRHDYNRYGNVGVTVCSDWFNFETFLKDIKEIDGWDKELLYNSKIQLDKDKKQFNLPHNKRIYSKDTCLWLSVEENYKYRKGPSCSDTCRKHSESVSTECLEGTCI